MDTDIFDGRIHGSKRALAQTRYPAKSASWIALASDIEKRMSAEAPIPRRSIGLDSAASVSATFGDLDQISGSGYVNALIEILVRFPNHCHLFAGKGNVRAMRQSMHAEGVLPRVRFLGEMSNVAPLLDGLDFYLAPFPNFECGFVLDAMGAGKPVVIQRQSSDPKNGCGSDLVADDDLVVDSVGGYVEAVSRIIRKTDLRKRVSEAVRQRFHSEYSPQRLAQRHLEYFKEIASRV
jgi:hypothetical protein